ncbi:MAG: DUF86 domain-containing protein [bacterium]
MSKRSEALYIQDIHDAISKIEEYVDGVSYEDMCHNSMLVDAIVRNLTIIGEAAARLSEEYKEQNSHIPWSEIIGMRNKVVHEYFGIDEEILWKTVTDDILTLKQYFESSKK